MKSGVCGVATSLLLLCSCSRHEPAAASASSGNGAPPSVPVVAASRSDVSSALTLTAEFIPYQEVDVLAKVAGYLKGISVDVGDRVKKGQVIATLEIPEMRDDLTRAAAAIEQANAEMTRAEDEVRRAEAAHQNAHLSLTRIESVAKREPGLVPQQDVDDVRSRDLVSEAQIASAKNAVIAAQQRIRVLRADEARLKTVQQYESITAPFDGVVTKRYANDGAMIQAGTSSPAALPVVKVSEIRVLRLILPVPESSVARVSPGKTVQVRVPSLGRVLTGRVARFSGKVQPGTRTMDAEVDVQNESQGLMPGMYAEVDLHLEEHKGVVTVPIDAIDGTGPGARVFQVIDPGVIRVVPISVGLQTAQVAEIKSGLVAGDSVIVGRRAGLKEGDRVSPVKATFTTPEAAAH
jgi:RND family efflux transporter MFP subunit